MVREALRAGTSRLVLLDRVPLWPRAANETVHTVELAYEPVDNTEEYAAGVAGAELPTDPSAPRAGPYALPEVTLKHLRA
ncbi:hypothetical protein ABZ208_14105 [Streptomyces sp. NPDC006208]|uniref:hypothetical protein n=1 Tax=Streptomyces sp. NPDC006208 TaxID=3156734 RepID=UPI0033A8A475